MSARRFAAVLAVAACGGGCKWRPGAAPAPRLVEIRVVDRVVDGAGEPAGAIDTNAVAARVADRVRASGAIAVAEGAEPRAAVDCRLKLDVALAVDEGGTGGSRRLRALVVSRLSRVDAVAEPAIESRVAAERRLAAGEKPDAAALRAHLDRAVDDGMRVLLAKLKLHLGGVRELQAGLADADPEVRLEAIRAAALRKDPATVPALIALLKSDEPELRDQAIGALLEIGDRRAVKPISQLARFGDTDGLPKVIDAMAALGGDEARAFLEFVISAHEDPDMRALAEEARARLDRHARPGSLSPGP